MKKIVATVMATTMLFCSHPIISHANTPLNASTPIGLQSGLSNKSSDFMENNKVGLVETQPLKEQRKQTAEKINSPEFNALTIQEKLALLQQYTSLQNELYDEYQVSLVSGKHDVKKLKKSILEDNHALHSDYKVIYDALQEVYELPFDDRVLLKEDLTTLLTEVKEVRESGRKVYESILSKEKADNASQIKLLNQMVLRSLKNDNIDQAIESLSKVTSLSGGDIGVIENLQQLLEDEPFILFENTPIQLGDNLVKHEDSWFINVEHLREIASFKVNYETGDETKPESWKISLGNKTLQKYPDHIVFNKESIGNIDVFIEEEEALFVDLAFFFELFGFEVSYHEDIPMIKTSVFETTEIDEFSVTELVKSLF